ncbi:MAG: hypothetical protein H0U10_12250 [Chloroflexia bacterium]|nr:hypothetical protein [Chloroflexia bacterium]
MTARDPVRFSRIVMDETPSAADFFSDEAAGKPRPAVGDPERLQMWREFSVYATETQARNKARGLGLGSHLVEITIPSDSRITYRRTGKTRGHHTVWRSPEEVERCVTRVVNV